jgi:hypothetical protein
MQIYPKLSVSMPDIGTFPTKGGMVEERREAYK